MASTAQVAKTLRVAHGIASSEPDVAVLARALVDRHGNVVQSADEISEGESPSFGSPNLIEAGDTVTIGANSQAAVFGTFTVEGALIVEGQVRFGPWPF